MDYIGDWLYEKNLFPTLEHCVEDLILIEDCPMDYDDETIDRAKLYIITVFGITLERLYGLKLKYLMHGNWE